MQQPYLVENFDFYHFAKFSWLSEQIYRNYNNFLLT